MWKRAVCCLWPVYTAALWCTTNIDSNMSDLRIKTGWIWLAVFKVLCGARHLSPDVTNIQKIITRQSSVERFSISQLSELDYQYLIRTHCLSSVIVWNILGLYQIDVSREGKENEGRERWRMFNSKVLKTQTGVVVIHSRHLTPLPSVCPRGMSSIIYK